MSASRFIAVIICFFTIVCSSKIFAQSVSGEINTDTTWTSDSDIIVTGNITINASAKLTINPGT
ncbi:hypothetical protein ACFL67_02460, partial [candidate division KSB1 bacterium]